MNFLIILAALAIPLIIVMIYKLSTSIKKLVDKARTDLNQNGFVQDIAYMRPIGNLTRIWGKLTEATPLYIQVSSFDPLSVCVGNTGLFDIKVGDADFDVCFVVRSNNREKAIQVLNPNLRKAFREIVDVRFRTGSIITLLGIDYFPEIKEKELRNFWMIEQKVNPDPSKLKQLHQLGLDMVKEIEKVCQDWPLEKKLKTTLFEGR